MKHIGQESGAQQETYLFTCHTFFDLRYHFMRYKVALLYSDTVRGKNTHELFKAGRRLCFSTQVI